MVAVVFIHRKKLSISQLCFRQQIFPSTNIHTFTEGEKYTVGHLFSSLLIISLFSIYSPLFFFSSPLFFISSLLFSFCSHLSSLLNIFSSFFLLALFLYIFILFLFSCICFILFSVFSLFFSPPVLLCPVISYLFS